MPQPKTKDGLVVAARQRARIKKEVKTGHTNISVNKMGRLVVGASVGDERGILVFSSVSLDEILAWLPTMIRKSQDHAADLAIAEIEYD